MPTRYVVARKVRGRYLFLSWDGTWGRFEKARTYERTDAASKEAAKHKAIVIGL